MMVKGIDQDSAVVGLMGFAGTDEADTVPLVLVFLLSNSL